MTLHLAAFLTKQDWIATLIAAIVSLAVLGYGWRDVSRYGFRRVRAIAGICFTEASRRRVFWITPLAIIGIIAISQLTRPLDELDAVRQTTRYCLFASGTIVILAAVLLACTNLPKEIESRVIFTIVTKPTTRLEIVMGKVFGFALVSGTILLIMGAFTFCFLQIRAWSMLSNAKTELQALGPAEVLPTTAPTTQPATASGHPTEVDPNASKARIRRQTLQRYIEGGLLGTKSMSWPTDMEVFAKDPGANAAGDSRKWLGGTTQNYCLIPLPISERDRDAMIEAVRASSGNRLPYLVIQLYIDQAGNPDPEIIKDLERAHAPMENGKYSPQIQVAIRSAHTGGYVAKDVFQSKGSVGVVADPVPNPNWKPGGVREYRLKLFTDKDKLTTAGLSELLQEEQLNIEIAGVTSIYQYGVSNSPNDRATPAAVVLPDGTVDKPDFGSPRVSVMLPNLNLSVDPPVVDESTPPAPPGIRFLGRFGRTGIQLPGKAPDIGDGLVAVYHFRDVAAPDAPGGKVILQTKISVDRGGDLDAEKYRYSIASVNVRNRKSGYLSPTVEIEPQTGRTIDIAVPAESVDGGDFDVLVRGRTPGQLLAMHGLTASVPSITLVRSNDSFLINLFKSLLLLWLLSILVVAISVFCSTFLSWPIAVVLTLILLLGRWGIDTLGDSLAPGGSRGIAQDLFKIRDPGKNKAVTDSLEALSTVLRTVGPILPDVNQFPVFEDLDRGINIEPLKVGRAGWELLVYGMPLMLLTYFILRNKEVAP